ncbi:MAG: phosphoglucosamine mutase [Bacillota bacterium]
MGRLFGTDGVRGVANLDLTPEMAFYLGRTGSGLLGQGSERPRFVVGRDTRLSGPLLESALISGILSTGAGVFRAGVMTTPGVAYLTRELGASGGVVVSASHNPFQYNGIKFFGPTGEKIPESWEAAIERSILSGHDTYPRPTASSIGRDVSLGDAVERYAGFLMGTGVSLSGLTVAVDCANGAASRISPVVFQGLGARVIPLASDPDGSNINMECGSLHPKCLARAVVEHGAHLGIALDGDADRAIVVDEGGRVLDGDYILAIIGLDRMEKGNLAGNSLVATVMSNVGLDIAFRRAGGRVVRSQVGDRCVLEEMRNTKAVLGGEQSGHVIFLEHLPTGDGILTAVQLAQVMKESGLPLSELAKVMVKVPQEVRNVLVTKKEDVATSPGVLAAVGEAASTLGDTGRVLVRPSGTEPVVRIMVEAECPALVKGLTDMLEEVIRAELG